jgi:DNA-binding XRE family transcriptional regulator
LKLIALAESADDVRAFDEAAAQADGETCSAQMVARLVSGDDPVLVWREHRGMSRGALAKAAGISAPYLSQIETGKRPGTIQVMKNLAKVLGADVDDLV